MTFFFFFSTYNIQFNCLNQQAICIQEIYVSISNEENNIGFFLNYLYSFWIVKQRVDEKKNKFFFNPLPCSTSEECQLV